MSATFKNNKKISSANVFNISSQMLSFQCQS